jgi:PAS domain S-box-containing protein
MYLVAGVLALLAAVMPDGDHLDRPLVAVLGTVDIGFAAVARSLPWGRWPRRATLLLFPLTLVMIQLFASAGALAQDTYPVFFIASFVWVGISHPSRTSYYLAPLAALAYLVPLITNAPVGDVAGSVAFVIPLCVLISETIARSTSATAEGERLEGEVAKVRAVAESERHYRQIFEGASEGINVVSSDGRLKDVNTALALMLGYESPEALLRTVSHARGLLMGDGDRQKITDAITERGHVEGLEIQLRQRDGTPLSVRASVSTTTDAEGNVIGFQSRMIDITQRRMLEEQLRQAQKMEAVGRLAGGIAHDFNNLLAIVLNYAQFVEDELEQGDPRREDLAQIRNAADKAVQLTRKLLSFSRTSSKVVRVIDVNELVTDLKSLLGRSLGDDLELRVHLGAGEVLVEGDPTALEQVLLNLAVNARDAMPGGGRLDIETSHIETGDRGVQEWDSDLAPGRYVLIKVSDTGVGMDEETRSMIFEPFFTTKPKELGTGLGLSTVYGIVTQSGGGIHVYSEVGLGTTFRVYLPASDSGVSGAEEISAPDGAKGSERILVVDDEEAIAGIVERILSGAGYDVAVASSPEAALAIVREMGGCDLLVSDVVMPRRSGPEVASALRELFPYLKTLYMSGYSGQLLVHHGLQQNELLDKPFSARELLDRVREILDSPSTKSAPVVDVGSKTHSVLIVDDDPLVRTMLTRIVGAAEGFNVIGEAVDAADAISTARVKRPDIVVIDFVMPGMEVAEAVSYLRRDLPDSMLICISAELTEKPPWADVFLPKSELVELPTLLRRIVPRG